MLTNICDATERNMEPRGCISKGVTPAYEMPVCVFGGESCTLMGISDAT